MWDVRVAELAGRQFNRVSRRQLIELGLSEPTIERRLASGRLVIVEEAVYAVSPVLEHDEWGRWMGATLTTPASVLSHVSAGAAWGFWSLRRPLETITRPGSGGPRRHGGIRVYGCRRPAWALETLRTARRPLPRLNVRIAGEEADLSWPGARLIVEIDGGPFHLDVGEDARKQAAWESAGWIVRRLSAEDVYEHPDRLLALCPADNVPDYPGK